MRFRSQKFRGQGKAGGYFPNCVKFSPYGTAPASNDCIIPIALSIWVILFNF
jgi:hypothetical protein